MKPREYLEAVVEHVRRTAPDVFASVADEHPHAFARCHLVNETGVVDYTFDGARLRADPFHVYWQADDGTNHDYGSVPVESAAERLVEYAHGRTDDSGTLAAVYDELRKFTTFKHRLKLEPQVIIIDDDRPMKGPRDGQRSERTLAYLVSGGGGICIAVPYGVDVSEVCDSEQKRGSPVRMSVTGTGLVLPTAGYASRLIARVWTPYFHPAPMSEGPSAERWCLEQEQLDKDAQAAKDAMTRPTPDPVMEQLTTFVNELRDALEAPTASMAELVVQVKAAMRALDLLAVPPGTLFERINELNKRGVESEERLKLNGWKLALAEETIADSITALDEADVMLAGCDLRVRIGAMLGAREEK